MAFGYSQSHPTSAQEKQIFGNGQHFTHLAIRPGDHLLPPNSPRRRLSTPSVWERVPFSGGKPSSTVRSGSAGRIARRRRNC